MIESTAANIAQHFAEYLAKVEQGETVRIREQGRAVARMVPDCDFMSGAKAANFFSGHQPDQEAADALTAELKKLDQESENALADRH